MLTLSDLSLSLAIARLEPSSPISYGAIDGFGFFSITKTHDELSIVCEEEKVPFQVKAEKGWGCLKFEGPLDFALTGILASLALPLEAGISILLFQLSIQITSSSRKKPSKSKNHSKSVL